MKYHPQPEELTEELSLEDIIKEFSAPDPEEELLREFSPKKTARPAQSPSGDTVRLDRIPTDVRRYATSQDTQPFQPVGGAVPPEPEIPAPAPKPRPVIEPFSESWEPEYEEPMGNYTPKTAIPFQTRDQSRILREKLVEGPEKRYYELAENGVAVLRLSAFILFMLFLTSAGVTMAFHWGYIGVHRSKMVVFIQLLSVLVAALLCHGPIWDGLAGLLRGRFTLRSLMAITGIVCCIDGLACLGQERLSCASVFCLQTAVAQWAACHARLREIRQMDTLRKASELTAVVKLEDYYDGLPGYVAAPGELEDFLDHYEAPAGPEQQMHVFAAIGAVICLVLSITIGLKSGLVTGVQTLTAGLLVLMPATALISMRRPEAVLQKRLHALDVVLCGWQGVKAVEKQAVFPVTHDDLFPADAIDLNGMKFYGSVDPDMVLCYTGSLIAHEGGSLKAVFEPLMASRYIRHAVVEEFGSYPGGLSALVDGEPIAVGTLEFMGQMEVTVPKAAQIAGAVYTAVDGHLSGVFALRCNRSKAAAAGLRNLCGNAKVVPLFLSRDFLLTGRFLREKLKVNTHSLVYPHPDTRVELAQMTPTEDAPVVALMVRKGLQPRSVALTGAMALKTAQKGGALIHILGGGLGLLAVAVLSLIGATHLLTPMNLLLYSLIWMVPGFLITEWTRYI